MEVHIAKVHDVVKGEQIHGTPILVDRLWPRGISRAKLAGVTWLKDAAPSPGLRHWFNHEPARFDEFSRRYRAELDQRAGTGDVQKLVDAATAGPVTLLYAAADRKHNHAMVLADWLRT
ncbi:DUF488 domain-containing protein [Corynebacterium pacaense]|uniref:DUF488 domain-containing protein n=1 Tax=Corynebacterium pacaense TaxID=1816684 RepID=UPI0009BC6432|nr:DUF488 family protein [Corynebacterium pacaense]